jgi:hypothetical protein
MEESRYSSRKFILALITTLSPIILLVFKFIDQTTYMTLSGGALALYYTGNVAQKAIEQKSALEPTAK